jgi:Phage derived protein Gp49-like (DUF891)
MPRRSCGVSGCCTVNDTPLGFIMVLATVYLATLQHPCYIPWHGKVMRVAFAFDPGRAAILLVAGDKSGISQKRFYKRLIAKADELFDAYLAAVKQRKKGKK